MYSGGEKIPKGQIPRGHIPTSKLDEYHCPLKAKDGVFYGRGKNCAGKKVAIRDARGRVVKVVNAKGPEGIPLGPEHLNRCVPEGKEKDSFQYYVRKIPPDSPFYKYHGLAGLRLFAAQVWYQISTRLKRQYPRTIPLIKLKEANEEFIRKIRLGTPFLSVPWAKDYKLKLGYCRKEQTRTVIRDGEDKTIKTVHPHGGRYPLKFVPEAGRRNPNKECSARTGQHITIYRNCMCAVRGKGKECEDLKPKNFDVYKPKAGHIKATLFINPITREVKAIPVERGHKPPKNFRHLSFTELKELLAQHDEKGIKLLFKLGAIEKAKDIFRSEKDVEKAHFVIQMDTNTYLAYHSEFDANIHNQVLPWGVYLTHEEALAVVKAINSSSECKKAALHVTPLNSLNFCFEAAKVHTHEDGTKAYYYRFPNDVHTLTPIRTFLKKQLDNGGIKGLSNKRLKKLILKFETWLRGEDDRKQSIKMSKKQLDAQGFWGIVSVVVQVVGIVGSVLLFGYFIAPEKTIPILKKMGGRIKRGVLAPIRALRWIGRQIQTKILRKPLTEKQKAYLEERRVEKEQKQMPWFQDIKGVVQDGRDQVEIQKDTLRANPDRLIIGREEETKEYILAMKKTRFGHPALVGDSGSGKEYVLLSFAQKVAMAQLWEDDDFRKNVSSNHPELVAAYEEADQMMNTDELRYKRVFIADLTAMQADTSLRGQFAKVLNNIKRAVHEGNSLVVFKELVDMLEAGAAGRMEEGQQHSESFAVMFKQMLEREGAHYGMDTLSNRLLKMLRNPKFDDFIRRIKVISVKVMSPQEILRVMQGRYVLGNFEDSYNVRISEGAVEAATRLGIHLYGRSGPPMNAAYSTLEESIQFALEEANKKGVNGKNTTIDITKEHVYQFLTVKKGKYFDDPDQLGRDTMELGSEHFTTREGMKAHEALEEGIRTGSIRVPADERLVDSKLGFDEDIRVRKLALSIDTRQLGEIEMMSDDTKAKSAVKYARRMLEILGDRDFGIDNKQWEAFVDNNLRYVMPITKEQLGDRPLNNVLHWKILQRMNPAKYDSLDTQLVVAAKLSEGFKTELPALMQANQGKSHEQLMTLYVENYECNPILPREIGSSAIPESLHQIWGTDPYEVTIGKEILKHMDAQAMEGFYGRDKVTAMRVVIQRLGVMLDRVDGPVDMERFVAENIGNIRPWTIEELESEAQKHGIQLNKDVISNAIWLDPAKYKDPANLLQVAEEMANLNVGYATARGQVLLPNFEEKEGIARMLLFPEEKPEDTKNGKGPGGSKGGPANPPAAPKAPAGSAPPAAPVPNTFDHQAKQCVAPTRQELMEAARRAGFPENFIPEYIANAAKLNPASFSNIDELIKTAHQYTILENFVSLDGVEEELKIKMAFYLRNLDTEMTSDVMLIKRLAKSLKTREGMVRFERDGRDPSGKSFKLFREPYGSDKDPGDNGSAGAKPPATPGALKPPVSNPPPGSTPPAQGGRSLISHLTEVEREAYRKIYQSFLNEYGTNERAAQMAALNLIKELRKGGEANVASVMNLSDSDIWALTRKAAVVNLDKVSRPRSTGLEGVRGNRDKDTMRREREQARGRREINRGMKRGLSEFFRPKGR